MGERCDYFASAAWNQRLESHVDHVWDMTDLFDHHDGIADREAALARLTEQRGDESREATVETPLSELLAKEVPVDATLDMSTAVETWLGTRDFDLPEQCPHEAGTGRLCVFHRPAGETSDAEVREAFLEALADDRRSIFVGAKVDNLLLNHETLSAPTNHAIDLRFATVERLLDLQNATVEQDLALHGARVDALKCSGATFTGEVRAMDADFWWRTDREGTELAGREYEFGNDYAEFEGEIAFDGAEFRDQADFKRTTFGGDTSFNGAQFDRTAVFNYARFGGSLDCMHAVFDGKADFSKSTTAENGIFYATFRDKAVFNYTRFGGRVEFWSADFHDFVDFWATTFEGDADFRYADFRDYVSIRESSFDGRADFTGATFADDVHLDRLRSGTEPIDMTRAELSGGRIVQPDHGECLYDCTETSIGDVRIEGPHPACLLADFRFVETSFQGFDFAAHRDALGGGQPTSDDDFTLSGVVRAPLETLRSLLGTDWDIHTFVDDTEYSPETLESTYLRAKNGANQVGDSKGASEFFLKEMAYRRQRYWDTGAYGSWAVNWFYNVTCGYGERPLRTVGFSLAIVLLFTSIFRVLGLNLGGNSGSGSYLVFSLQSFVTLILGSVPGSQTTAVRLAAAFEAFIGAFLIALFVFALTRSIHR